MNIETTKTVSEMVAEDYRTAAVFKSNGIDFCCGGKISIEQACKNKDVNPAVLVEDLKQALKTPDSTAVDYNSWPLDLLADYIQKKHHRYVEERIPVLRIYLNTVCGVHGDNHPELNEINELFEASASQLTAHMKKEELILFPFVRTMVKAKITSTKLEPPLFGTVKNPIEAMMKEHDNEGERFRVIAALSNNYSVPADACNTYMVTFAYLKEFEADLHLHIHLENNILFPKAAAMEKELLGVSSDL